MTIHRLLDSSSVTGVSPPRVPTDPFGFFINAADGILPPAPGQRQFVAIVTMGLFPPGDFAFFWNWVSLSGMTQVGSPIVLPVPVPNPPPPHNYFNQTAWWLFEGPCVAGTPNPNPLTFTSINPKTGTYSWAAWQFRMENVEDVWMVGPVRTVVPCVTPFSAVSGSATPEADGLYVCLRVDNIGDNPVTSLNGDGSAFDPLGGVHSYHLATIGNAGFDHAVSLEVWIDGNPHVAGDHPAVAGTVNDDPQRQSFALFAFGPTPAPARPICGVGASGPLQFLELDGVELANAYRNFQYLRLSSGAARPKWEIATNAPCSVLAREIPYTPASPQADPAPWYDPDLPESADFLGLIITDIEGFDFNVTRAVTQRQSGVQGALLGPQLKGPRELKFTGSLLSDGACCGIEYGKRWLIHRLAQFCDGCSTQTLRVRLVCPPDNGSDDAQGEWYVFDAALVDGPHWQNPQPSTCCDYQDVAFTMVSEDPYLYRLPVMCAAGPLGVSDSGGCIAFCDWLNDRSDPICCTVDVPSGYGEVCGVVTVETSSVPVGGVEIRTYADPCGPSGSALQTITIPFLPANSSLTYDSARQRITFTDAAGVSSDGTPYISLEAGRSVEWVQVSDCAPARCICVDAATNYSDGSATVTLATQFRAL